MENPYLEVRKPRREWKILKKAETYFCLDENRAHGVFFLFNKGSRVKKSLDLGVFVERR